MNVAILGASPKPDRYSNRAMKLLTKHGHRVFLVHPSHQEIDGLKCYKNLQSISEKVDTLTVYVGPQHQAALIDDILQKKPTRVILNPGTEGKELMSALQKNKIPFLEACTLVLLNTNQF